MRVEVARIVQHEAQHLRIGRLVDVAQLIAHVAVVIGAQLRADDIEHRRRQLLAALPLFVQQRSAEGDRPKDVDHGFIVRQWRVPLADQAAHFREGGLGVGAGVGRVQHRKGG